VVGLIAQTRRRTVCGMLTGAGLERLWHHSRAHRSFAVARWSADAVGLVLADVIVPYKVPRNVVAVADQLATPHGLMDTRYHLAAAAALKGHTGLAELLNNLDFYTERQEYGESMIDLPDGLAPA
jgi:DDE superfamily endonuclease